MKRLKYLLVILLGALFAVALAACGGGDDDEKYTVTFETDGGTAIAPYSLSEGDIIERPADPTKPLFTFAGWYADAAHAESYAFGQAMPAYDVTVYAAWTAEKSSRIQYNSMGGSAVAPSVGKVGTSLSAPEDPAYEGYRFGGWYTDEACTQAFSFTVFPAESLTLYARWENDPAYAYITYMGNGDRIALTPVKKGAAIAEPQLFGEDIVSTGWFTDPNLTRAYTFGGAAAADITLYTSYYTKGLEISGNNVVRYTGESANVIVPNRIGTSVILTIGDRAFAEQTQVVTVDLPATIGKIGDAAFYRCSYLTDIDLGASVTGLGANAFFDCSRLVSYGTIEGVSAIPEGLFLGCKKLPAVTLSDKVTSIGKQAFADCAILKEMDIPDGVTAIEDGLFDGCSALQKVKLPARLRTFGTNVFKHCGALSELTLAESNTSFRLTEGNLYRGSELVYYVSGAKEQTEFRIPQTTTRVAAGAFDSNATLQTVVVESASTVLECGAFAGMQGITSLTLPALGGSGFLAYSFGATQRETGSRSGCIPETLRSVTLTGAPTSIAENAFTGAVGLTEINGLEKVTSVGDYAFAYTALQSFTVSPELGYIGEGAFAGCKSFMEFTMSGASSAYSAYDGCLYNGSGTILLAVPAAKKTVSFPATATTIASYAFTACDVEEVTIPSSITSIAFAAFSDCASIRRLTVPYLGDNDGHDYLAYIFGATLEIAEDEEGNPALMGYNTSSVPRTLEEVTVTKEYAAIPDMAFAMFFGLNKANVPGTVTSYGAYSFFQTSVEEIDFTGVVSIGTCAFRGSDLTAVSLPATLTSFGDGAFSAIADLERIELAEGITEIAPRAFYAYAYNATMSETDEYQLAFLSSVNREIVIPSTVTKIGEDAFFGQGMQYDSELRRNVANEWFAVRFNAVGGTSALREIASGAFAYSALRTLSLPAGVETVGDGAFADCVEFEAVTFGAAEETGALTTLGNLCFENCTALKSLTLHVQAVIPMGLDHGNDIFYGAAEDFSVYVPSALVDAFKAAENWSAHAGKIFAVGAEGGAL